MEINPIVCYVASMIYRGLKRSPKLKRKNVILSGKKCSLFDMEIIISSTPVNDLIEGSKWKTQSINETDEIILGDEW